MRRTSARSVGVGLVALLLSGAAAVGATALAGTSAPAGAADFGGVSGSTNSSAWSRASVTAAVISSPPTSSLVAGLSPSHPANVTTTVHNFNGIGNASAGVQLDMSWTVTVAAGAALGTEFVIHYHLSGAHFASISAAAYFLLPSTGVGPWTLVLFVALAASSPPPGLTVAEVDVFACTLLGSCP
jgi:hypothetical protein